MHMYMKKLLFTSALIGICGSAWAAENTPAALLPTLKNASIAVDGHPESVATDEQGNIYFTCIGAKMTPTEKDSDGYLAIIPYGSTEVKKLTEEGLLHAPKGLLYKDGFLYCADIDTVYKINAKDGTVSAKVSLAAMRMHFLNDMAIINGRFMVSATDTDQLFYVDFDTQSYGELRPKQKIYMPNGLAWDADRKLIYMCEYMKDAKGKATGRLVSIHPVTREVTELSRERGSFDGLIYHQGELYYSDWEFSKHAKAVRKMNLKSGISKPVATAPVDGAADFTVYGNKLIVPGMTERKIHIMDIGTKK